MSLLFPPFREKLGNYLAAAIALLGLAYAQDGRDPANFADGGSVHSRNFAKLHNQLEKPWPER